MDEKQQQQHRQTDADNWGEKGFEQGGGQGSSESGYEGRQENQKHRGYEEDQPKQPLRASNETPEEQKGESSESGKTYDDKTT